MNKLLFLLIFSLLAFTSFAHSELQRPKKMKSVEVGFYEVYSNSIMAYTMKSVHDWVKQNDAVLTQNNIKNHNLALLLESNSYDDAVIGRVNAEDIESVSAILALKEIQALLPPGTKFMWALKPEESPESETQKYELYAVKIPESGEAILNGKHIERASAEKNETLGTMVISIQMTAEGTEVWSDMTRNNVQFHIAIVFDGKVVFCPKVESEITTGEVNILGDFSDQEAADLAKAINTGRK